MDATNTKELRAVAEDCEGDAAVFAPDTVLALLDENDRLRALLWDFVAAPVAGSNEELQAIAVSHQLWNDAAEAVGYDEMGQ